MPHSCPTRRRVSIDLSLRAGVLGLLVMAAGCGNGAGSSATGGAGASPGRDSSAAGSTSYEKSKGVTGTDLSASNPAARGAGSGDRARAGPGAQAPAGSQVEGDRMKSFAPVIMSKQTESSPFRFAEIAREAGIDFVHFSGMTDEKHFPTANGSGVAVFDFDGDGLLDIYFASATLLPLGHRREGAKPAVQEPRQRPLPRRDRDPRAWATAASATGSSPATSTTTVMSTSSCATTAATPCTSTTATGPSRTSASPPGSTRPTGRPAARCSTIDNDGFLDIYVSNYGIWKYPEDHQLVGDAAKKVWLYASPRTIKTTEHLLFHNNRNGTFTNVYDKVFTADKDVLDPKTNEPVKDPKTGAVKKVRVPSPEGEGRGTDSASWPPTSTTTA